MIIEVGGVRGGYEVAGDGPPLVLLASPVARAETYRATAECLARSFRVHTVELPGSGQAECLPEGWSIEQYAGWVAELLRTLALDRPVVIGHSHSAAIGVVLAARFPERLGRLVVVDGTGTGPHPSLRVFLGGLFDLALDITLVLRAWHHVVGNLLVHTANFWRQIRDGLKGDVRADAARVSVPVLVAWGRRDHTFPPRCAREYARCLPDAQVYLSPSGSHDWLISQADEFADVVTAFAWNSLQ